MPSGNKQPVSNKVIFQNVLERFTYGKTMQNVIKKHKYSGQELQRSGDIVWLPRPMQAVVRSGIDQTGNFGKKVKQMAPATLGFHRSCPSQLDAYEMRDALDRDELGIPEAEALSAEVELALLNTAATGSITVQQTTACSYKGIQTAKMRLGELGVKTGALHLGLSERDYLELPHDLVTKNATGKTAEAFKNGVVGDMVAGFEMHRIEITPESTIFAATGVTINGANQYSVPVATVTTAEGEQNVDFRAANLAITVGGNAVKVGDRFTIAGVYAVHPVTKQTLPDLKTFYVRELVSGGGGTGTIKVWPQIISGQGGTDAELACKNVSATPAHGAAITFLNTATKPANPFWAESSIILLPGNLGVSPRSSDKGILVGRGSAGGGVELLMFEYEDIDTLTTKFRFDILFGTANIDPEQNGVLLFNQV